MSATNNQTGPAKKRSYEVAMAPPATTAEEEVEETFTETEMAAMSRSERKRHREKKRRSDVNKGFDELMGLLLHIDPEVRAEAEERASKGQCKRSLGAHEDNVLSRVDLIATAITVLKKVHGENEKHKAIIADLLKGKAESMATSHSSVASFAAPSAAPSAFNANPAALFDRASFLQGLGSSGTSAQAVWEAAQKRRAAAQASLFGSQMGGYSPVDIMALRAAQAQANSSSDNASMLAQLSHRNALLQSVFNTGPSSSAAPTSLGGSTNGTASFTEALYGALGPGQMPNQNKHAETHAEHELRRLRAERSIM